MKKYKIASLFAGIGGIDLGFELAGAETVWANEIDSFCGVTFTENFKNTDLVIDDILNVNGKDIPKIDILTGGFPCQPFSVAGYRKGFDDDRGNMFFEITRLILELEKNNNKPRVIFLENVKNLRTHDNGRTYRIIEEKLQELGYIVESKIMNSCEYGNTPQNRERIFILGFLREEDYKNFKWPEKIQLTEKLNDIIGFSEVVADKYYYTENVKCYPMVKEGIQKTNTIYQFRRVYVRENKGKLCPTLTANMGMGGHNVPLILDKNKNIRKLTPRECLLLQGFPASYNIPEELADSKVYKQAGNAVSVGVIRRLAENIIKAMR